MRYLVTGAGMLGTALAARLREDGHEVVLADLAARPGVAHLDLREPASIRPLLPGVDGIFHTAGHHGWREVAPREFFDVNVAGAWNLYEATVAAGLIKVVHSSTVGVYGAAPVTIGPDTPPGPSADPYDFSKRLAEEVLAHFAAQGLAAVALRYGGFAQLIRERYGRLPPEWARSGALVDLADVVEANVIAMARLPLPRFAYVVIPSGGEPEGPYRVDASATEGDLGLSFRTGYARFRESSPE